MGDFAGLSLFSVSAIIIIAVQSGIRKSSQLEKCFHCWLKQTVSFSAISQPPCRQPIPTRLLFLPLWPYYAQPLGASPHGTPDWKTRAFYRIIPGPFMSASQVPCAFILNLYPLGLLLLLLLLLLIYLDSSGYCMKETSICLWAKYVVGTSSEILPWTIQAGLHSSCFTFSWPLFLHSCILSFNNLFTGVFLH